MNNSLILLQGFRLLLKPKIRHFVIWPLLLNILIFAGLVYGAYYLGLYAQQQSLAFLPSWLSYISWLIWPVIVLLVLLCLLRSEEHTSELQSRPHLVCRLLLEKKKK